MSRWSSVFLIVACLCGFSSRAADSQEGFDFFEKKIRPLLSEQCYRCHSAAAQSIKGGLKLDTKIAIQKGGDNGPVIIPGDPDNSRLITAVKWADTDLQMPPKKKLSDEQIAALVEWVKMGAPDP